MNFFPVIHSPWPLYHVASAPWILYSLVRKTFYSLNKSFYSLPRQFLAITLFLSFSVLLSCYIRSSLLPGNKGRFITLCATEAGMFYSVRCKGWVVCRISFHGNRKDWKERRGGLSGCLLPCDVVDVGRDNREGLLHYLSGSRARVCLWVSVLLTLEDYCSHSFSLYF